ncbi:phosphoenolpyruvate synthase [Methanofollis liminatans DSM 4140]|uniref:Phosphoenolpyruvate synthase n=1 Tax=Methanofollis liminatans DSM 4140 TaxID=28892 RepID=J1ANU0_9EURY|nr:phosphoenolpyruvate synthase [Methanofollis liminatans]EJG06553.1 phosphoenolpyruvate synthase [Methanofollis liminatans DSM 4140]
MTEMPNILWLEAISKDDIPLVGGKGASLGEMASVGLPVPKAFVVTAQAFRKFLVQTGLEDSLFDLLTDVDVENSEELEDVSRNVKNLVLDAKMPDDIKEEIIQAYGTMGPDNMVVAVRSSATAEDLPDASFAGQQETYLNIRGDAAVVEAVQMCWASLYGARAIYYRAKQGFDDRTVNIAVVVQQLIRSEKSGVMFSSHPVTGEPLTIIEGSWGLGEAVVSGSVSPDKYVYDRRLKKVFDRMISKKEYMIVPVGDHGTELVEIPNDRQEEPILSDAEVEALAAFAEISEEHYNVPQDIEWAIVGSTIYILQSRPITTIGMSTKAKGTGGQSTGAVLLEGNGASPGVASGPVIIVHDIKDLGKVKEGDILVTKMTNPDMVPAMRKVAGIVTDEGGMTCHAAIVSRELGTPAVVGTKKATKTLKDGDIITLDGEKGIVYEGAASVAAAPAAVMAAAVPGAAIAAAPIITATSIKVNVSLAEAAARAAATGADGVGLLRIEHMILGMNKTPGWYISQNKEEEFITELYNGIKVVLDAFPGKPVWVRTLDAPTDEFRNMLGGESEPIEHNPMLGWRGIRRDLQSPDQFRMQIEVFKRLWDRGYDNLGLMFPLVGHPDEFLKAKALIAGWGVDVDAVELGIMVEIPSSAILIEDFCKAGISFASFGTNDLIQYTLAIDRNNELVSSMYRPKHPAVLKLIRDAIAVCRQYGVECSICGQAGSDPKMVEWLIENGITSVSANIDAIPKIRETAARTEKRMILDAVRLKNA